MTSNADIYTDFQGLTKLRADVRANGNSTKNLREVASQFEALFTQMVLKSMREAKLADGLFGSDQEDQYLGMFDAQLALQLSKGSGLGLQDMLVKQLGNNSGAATPRGAENTDRIKERSRGERPPDPPGRELSPGTGRSLPSSGPAGLLFPQAGEGEFARPSAGFPGRAMDGSGQSPLAFAQSLWPHARKAAGRLGVAPEVLLAQAALETGWGKSLPRHPDGRSSHNVFGIKAGPQWRGERVAVPTLEFEDGVAVRKRAEFRSYASLEEGFADYVRLLTSGPRYREALEQSGDNASFAQALAHAGFATDPGYAGKINAVLNGKTLGTSVAALKISSEGPLT